MHSILADEPPGVGPLVQLGRRELEGGTDGQERLLAQVPAERGIERNLVLGDAVE